MRMYCNVQNAILTPELSFINRNNNQPTSLATNKLNVNVSEAEMINGPYRPRCQTKGWPKKE